MKKLCKSVLFSLLLLVSVIVASAALTSCKATRTITTSSTYTQVGDSAKTTTSIATKTVEEYIGTKKK